MQTTLAGVTRDLTFEKDATLPEGTDSVRSAGKETVVKVAPGLDKTTAFGPRGFTRGRGAGGASSSSSSGASSSGSAPRPNLASKRAALPQREGAAAKTPVIGQVI